MPVSGLNHVNIVTKDLAGTKRFYRDLLGLTEVDTAGMVPGVELHWLADPAGHTIIHLQRHDPARHGDGHSAQPTGNIDHVAFTCEDFDGMRARCAELGVACRAVEIAGAPFRLLFVNDPNDVQLELNFRNAAQPMESADVR